MTNHIVDLKNTDCALIMGSNAAENHPISMRWLLKSQRTTERQNHSCRSSLYQNFCPGRYLCPFKVRYCIAFLGGMIKYIIDNEKYHKDYVLAYTNASFLVKDEYGFEDGLFSGYDPENAAMMSAVGITNMMKTGFRLRILLCSIPVVFSNY